MNKFKVKTEYAPDRCEICHQSDLFNKAKNYCNRCDRTHLIQYRFRRQLAEQGLIFVRTKAVTALINSVHQIRFLFCVKTIVLILLISSVIVLNYHYIEDRWFGISLFYVLLGVFYTIIEIEKIEKDRVTKIERDELTKK